MGEARQLLSPSPTPSAAGSRFGALDDEENNRIEKMAIVVSEDEQDCADQLFESKVATDPVYCNLKEGLTYNPRSFMSKSEIILDLERELAEVKAGVRAHRDGLVKNLETEIATMAATIETLRKAVEVAEAEAARVRKMHSDHEGF